MACSSFFRNRIFYFERGISKFFGLEIALSGNLVIFLVWVFDFGGGFLR